MENCCINETAVEIARNSRRTEVRALVERAEARLDVCRGRLP